jgi:nucleoside-diphosphate-sugar epimerase
MRFLVTGTTGFLGWRSAVLLAQRGHDVVGLARPGGAPRAHVGDLDAVRADAGGPQARALIAGCDAVLHFAGVPDPARARSDPARAVRENAGTTLNLLEGCLEHDAALIYPSTTRAAGMGSPDPYALSKRLGEEVCRLHAAPTAVVRMTSVFGPGQVAWEGATGAIAAFAARALRGEPLVIPGDPHRTRDFLYVDDAVAALEWVAVQAEWDGTATLASGTATPLLDAARLVRAVAGSDSPIQTPGGTMAPAENASYQTGTDEPRLPCSVRPLREGVELYVDWLRRHPAAQGSTGA